MRILLASDFFYPKIGGISSHLEDLASFLLNKGHEVFVVSKKGNYNDSQFSFPVFRVNSVLGTSQPIDIPRTDELTTIIRKIQPDIIHSHHAFSPVSLLALKTAKELGIPTVLTNHSIQFLYDLDYIWKPASYVLFPYREYINKADKIIAVSNAAAEFISYFTNNHKNILVIPNGIKTKEFLPKKKEFDGKTILFTGRIVYRKGVHFLIEAMSRVIKKKKEAKLIIIGQGYFRPFIKNLIKIYHLEDNVILKKSLPRNQLKKYYQKANVFTCPSLYGESFGIVVLEAMASCTPVVASNQGGIKEIIRNGKTGLLVKKADIKDLTDKILLLLNDQKLSEEISKNALEEIKMNYDWEVVGGKIENVYLNLLKNKNDRLSKNL
jgi:glycosyltransferase involved in cell wall biosynthesis